MTEPLDISSEKYRIYTYADGTAFRIESPAQLYVLKDLEGVTHRVVDANGMTHRPNRNWVGISWKPREGAAPFVA